MLKLKVQEFQMSHVLLRTQDNKRFVILKKNIVDLKEFVDQFKINISLIKLKNGPVLSLEKLAESFCDHISEIAEYDYSIIEENISFDKLVEKKKKQKKGA
jgi:hypothetical protein